MKLKLYSGAELADRVSMDKGETCPYWLHYKVNSMIRTKVVSGMMIMTLHRIAGCPPLTTNGIISVIVKMK